MDAVYVDLLRTSFCYALVTLLCHYSISPHSSSCITFQLRLRVLLFRIQSKFAIAMATINAVLSIYPSTQNVCASACVCLCVEFVRPKD